MKLRRLITVGVIAVVLAVPAAIAGEAAAATGGGTCASDHPYLRVNAFGKAYCSAYEENNWTWTPAPTLIDFPLVSPADRVDGYVYFSGTFGGSSSPLLLYWTGTAWEPAQGSGGAAPLWDPYSQRFALTFDGTSIPKLSELTGVRFTAGILDVSPPALSVPSGPILDATSPQGALVEFSATATDTLDPNPMVACAPASGTVFSIGSTLVTCTATDDVGNVATGSFAVRVRGAPEQVVALIDKTLAYLELPALEATLKTRLESAATAWATKNKPAACTALSLYVAVVKLAPLSVLTAAQRADLIVDANRIKAVLACS